MGPTFNGLDIRGRANRLDTFHTWQLPERLLSLPTILDTYPTRTAPDGFRCSWSNPQT
jgi:hypothetical protein